MYFDKKKKPKVIPIKNRIVSLIVVFRVYVGELLGSNIESLSSTFRFKTNTYIAHRRAGQ